MDSVNYVKSGGYLIECAHILGTIKFKSRIALPLIVDVFEYSALKSNVALNYTGQFRWYVLHMEGIADGEIAVKTAIRGTVRHLPGMHSTKHWAMDYSY